MNKRFIFVCGFPKSGTTLLTALFDNHPQVMVLPAESKIFTFIIEVMRKQELLSPGELIQLFLNNTLFRFLPQRNPDLDYELFVNMIKEQFMASEQSVQDLLEALCSSYAHVSDQTEKLYWLEKTPFQEKHLGTILASYPSAKIIYVVRDPRDVYISYGEKRRLNTKKQVTLGEFIYTWGNSIWQWQQFAPYYPNLALVPYEELLTHPERTMRKICSFIGLDFTPQVLKPTMFGIPWKGNSMHGDQFNRISTKPIGRWYKHLPQTEARAIEAFLGQVMAWIGYQLEVPGGVSLTEAAQIWWSMFNWKERRYILGVLIRLYWPFRLPSPLIRRALPDSLRNT